MVVSRETLQDLAGAIRALKAERTGEIEIAGPNLAQSLTEFGLIDEYRLYLHPVVFGCGKPYFAGSRPPLRLTAHDRIGGCSQVDLCSCLIPRLARRTAKCGNCRDQRQRGNWWGQ